MNDSLEGVEENSLNTEEDNICDDEIVQAMDSKEKNILCQGNETSLEYKQRWGRTKLEFVIGIMIHWLVNMLLISPMISIG